MDSATVDSVVADVKYHVSFQLEDHNKKTPKKGGPRALAVAVDRSGKEWTNPFEWLSSFSIKVVKTRWDRAIAGTGICPICHRAEKPWDVPTNCPLLKDLNLKLVAGPPPHPVPAPANSPTPASAPASTSPEGRIASTDDSTSGSAPLGLMVSVAEEDYDFDPEFRWTGDEDGILYSVDSDSHKSNNRVSPYPSCSHAAVVSASLPSFPTMGLSSLSASLSRCDSLVDHSNSPPSISSALHSLLTRLSQCPIAPDSGGRLGIADSGATDHMFPDKSAFISYKTTSNLKVCTGNNTYLPVLAQGSAIISLNGQRVLVWNALHVPGLAVPLYSLRAHFKQCGCGFIGSNDAGMLVYFPSFVLSVNTSSDCTLSYEPLGRSAPLYTLHYVQPWSAPELYSSELSPSSNTVSKSPVLIEDDQLVSNFSPADCRLDRPPMVSSSLNSLPPSVLPSLPSHSTPVTTPKPPVLLSTMSPEEVAWLLHHPNTSLPDIHPCNTANASDTKVHWTSEEIHRIMGCRKSWNYKHIIEVSRDGEWMDGGEFHMSLGSYATIPKAKQDQSLYRTDYRYLDTVHMNIAFGDCVSVGGYHFALILVDRATRYNWAFGLKTLSSSCILLALQLFRAAAGSLAHCFYCDCNPKFFGMAISDYLINNQSKVVAAPAKCQSSNGLIESHWKIMVHMARGYLTE